ncbi:hypothetical protein D3C71_1322260 [compost metagenome]
MAQAHAGIDHIEGVPGKHDAQPFQLGCFVDPASRCLHLKIRALDELPVASGIEHRGWTLELHCSERPPVDLHFAAADADDTAQSLHVIEGDTQ